ncbi:hypothetical protein K505DRAFT_246619, partial [Melanomma pulvis-pyrius CBS 109.77]
KSTPCLLIFKDLDTLIRDKLRSYLLNKVNSLKSNNSILIIASANNIEKLNPTIRKELS